MDNSDADDFTVECNEIGLGLAAMHVCAVVGEKMTKSAVIRCRQVTALSVNFELRSICAKLGASGRSKEPLLLTLTGTEFLAWGP